MTDTPTTSVPIDMLLRLERDASRYRLIRDNPHCALSLTHNDHHASYETAQALIEYNAQYFQHCQRADLDAMIAAESIWTVHIYPNTPVSFSVYHAATLDAAIDAAMADPPEVWPKEATP